MIFINKTNWYNLSHKYRYGIDWKKKKKGKTLLHRYMDKYNIVFGSYSVPHIGHGHPSVNHNKVVKEI